MQPAVPVFRAAFLDVSFAESSAPVVSSTTTRFFDGDVCETLAGSLISPVRWINVMRKLRQHGVTRFLDVGPGKVLAGLVRRTIDDAETETLATRERALA